MFCYYFEMIIVMAKKIKDGASNNFFQIFLPGYICMLFLLCVCVCECVCVYVVCVYCVCILCVCVCLCS